MFLKAISALAELIVLPNGDDSKWYGVGFLTGLCLMTPACPITVPERFTWGICSGAT